MKHSDTIAIIATIVVCTVIASIVCITALKPTGTSDGDSDIVPNTQTPTDVPSISNGPAPGPNNTAPDVPGNGTDIVAQDYNVSIEVVNYYWNTVPGMGLSYDLIVTGNYSGPMYLQGTISGAESGITARYDLQMFLDTTNNGTVYVARETITAVVNTLGTSSINFTSYALDGEVLARSANLVIKCINPADALTFSSEHEYHYTPESTYTEDGRGYVLLNVYVDVLKRGSSPSGRLDYMASLSSASLSTVLEKNGTVYSKEVSVSMVEENQYEFVFKVPYWVWEWRTTNSVSFTVSVYGSLDGEYRLIGIGAVNGILSPYPSI